MKDNGCFYKELENQNSFGELLLRTRTESLGEKFEEDHVAECAQSNIDEDDSEGAS